MKDFMGGEILMMDRLHNNLSANDQIIKAEAISNIISISKMPVLFQIS